MPDPLVGTPGPFEVRCDPHNAQSPISITPGPLTIELPAATTDVPRRRYDCSCYETCLGLAASLNWQSFTCRGCCGQPNENLLWRARVSARKDSVAARLLQAPPIVPLTTTSPPLANERETSNAS